MTDDELAREAAESLLHWSDGSAAVCDWQMAGAVLEECHRRRWPMFVDYQPGWTPNVSIRGHSALVGGDEWPRAVLEAALMACVERSEVWPW